MFLEQFLVKGLEGVEFVAKNLLRMDQSLTLGNGQDSRFPLQVECTKTHRSLEPIERLIVVHLHSNAITKQVAQSVRSLRVSLHSKALSVRALCGVGHVDLTFSARTS